MSWFLLSRFALAGSVLLLACQRNPSPPASQSAGTAPPVPIIASTPLAPVPVAPSSAPTAVNGRTSDEQNTIDVFARVAPSTAFVTQKRIVVDYFRRRAFEVESGDGQKLSHRDLTGGVAVIMYERKEDVEKNRPLKDALNRLAKRQAGRAARWKAVPIVDTSSDNFITRPIWRRQLRKNSAKEGLTIYGDWDGTAAKALQVDRRDVNVLVTDSKGTVRYASVEKLSNPWPVVASHTFMMPSSLAEARRVPSGLTATLSAISAWPVNVSSRCNSGIDACSAFSASRV